MINLYNYKILLCIALSDGKDILMFEFNNNSFFAGNGQAPQTPVTPSQVPVSPFHAPAAPSQPSFTPPSQQSEEVKETPVQNTSSEINTAPQQTAASQSFAPQNNSEPADRSDNFIEGWDDDDDLDSISQRVNIKVFGVGGGGNNAVNRMYSIGDKSATLVAVNTDIRVLRSSPIQTKIAIGKHTTRGHGAGANPESGRKAAEESIEYIRKHLEGVDMLFITAGMGGGTGTGASPVIAKLAKEMGILTVAVVTKPFECEGEARMATAEDGIEKLRDCVDALIVVPNERLNTIAGKELPIAEAFEAADDILIKGVQSICRLINEESKINLDFADITAIFKNSGDAHIGVGIASGEDKAMLAAEQAITSPLLETSIEDADGMIVSIISSDKVPVTAITEATNRIRKDAAPNVKLIFGINFDATMGDTIEITVIATKSGGLKEQGSASAKPIENDEISFEGNLTTEEQAADPLADETKPNDFLGIKPENISVPSFEGKNDPLFRDEEFKLIQDIATKRGDR